MKDEVDGLGFTAAKGDFLLLGAIDLVPRCHRVPAWRKIGKPEAAIVLGNRDMAGFENNKISAHPGMNIAFHMDELLVFKGVRKGGSARQLNAVPFAVDFAKRVDIVIKGVAIGDAHVLPYAQREDMRSVLAVALVKGCGNVRGRAGGGITARNVHENMLQRVAGPGDDVFG